MIADEAMFNTCAEVRHEFELVFGKPVLLCSQASDLGLDNDCNGFRLIGDCTLLSLQVLQEHSAAVKPLQPPKHAAHSLCAFPSNQHKMQHVDK